MTPLDWAVCRLWLSLPYVRWSRRRGISTKRMLFLYVMVNWTAIAYLEWMIGLVR